MIQEQANWEWIDARVKKLEEHCFSAKTLTDEEIEYLLRESIWALGLNSDCLEQENWDDAITVFKSILRKAQEK